MFAGEDGAGQAAVPEGATEAICRFELETEAGAQTLSRLINYFAQRDLTPSSVRSDVTGDLLRLTIEQRAIDPAHARIIAEKMRASVLVHSLTLHIA
ncbi:MAG: hypothetical protein ABIY39_09840 [Sphingomonas sp.]